MNTHQLCGLLAEPSRLRTYSAVVLGAATPEQVAGTTGLSQAVVGKALQKLIKAGLVQAAPTLTADESVFKDAVRENAPEWTPLVDDPERDQVLKAFVRDGRLTHFPTYPEKLQVVLEYFATDFAPGRDYPEREVNEILNRRHADHAALRRMLVDARLLSRADSVYRRA
ncbi:DUF2087 domain-containing protein [Kribbella sandramycini]|uniref:DUF2087 domain-containing protein n=1 Tax=Kribbella sandramycini TaxID=60450 RepID=A0A7Y4NZG1_9ACTN|nr:DUF2087 domain-containing protein [Kribbella sandramycini]MBB6569343.1 hypothetical protein [Kribbella sandramycini]NOL40818.1 DUF2087 domain-containing protein [Kribbella sandramycini]